MRDPKRIPRIIKKLEKLWKKNPELRLGQLIDNYYSYWNNIFYVEDKDLERIMVEIYAMMIQG